MKRRFVLPALTIFLAPLALGVTSVHASGDDDHDDEQEQEQDHEDTPPPPSSTTPSSIPVGSVPSGGSRVSEIRSKLERALTKVDQSMLPEAVKVELRTRINALIGAFDAGQRIEPSVLEALSKAIEDASKRNRPNGSIPGSSIPSTTKPSMPPSSIGSGSVPDDDDDEIDDDGDNESDDDSDDSENGERHSEGRRDLAANIARATAALNALPASEARDAALAALATLQTRLDAGEIIPTDEVRAVFRSVASLVYERIGDRPDEDADAPALGEVPSEMVRQRMIGSINQALELLAGNTSEAATAAVAALEAVKATLDAGETPTREAFQNAMNLAREALEEVPASRAVLTLAGVIAAITASDMPDDVKARLLEVLGAAKDQILADPTIDPKQIVRDALNEVRDARIAATVAKMLDIATRLETAATDAGNTNALLLITEARALLQPSDGSLPDRDDLHHARRILVRVAIMLRASTSPSTTTEAPSTTVG
ncbi:MAG: hypothetical protein EBY07_02815 [Actinobacteria bacterium]|nr:hypothetical protein [Actinomycetota bacterium]